VGVGRGGLLGRRRITGWSLNTPAQDWRLRRTHDIAKYRWSRAQEGQILISGHTHRPVFRSRTHVAQVLEEFEDARERLAARPTDGDLLRRVAEHAAEVEWVRTQELTEPGREGIVELDLPSYFNTGCCSYLDGDITGIEIAEGEIRLVRWPDDEGRPRPHVLARAPLEEVLPEMRSSRVPIGSTRRSSGPRGWDETL